MLEPCMPSVVIVTDASYGATTLNIRRVTEDSQVCLIEGFGQLQTLKIAIQRLAIYALNSR